MLYFDLTAPDSLGTDQELWREVGKQIPKPGFLDMGMPKLRGEFLLAGKCHVPRGKPAMEAVSVSVRAGQVSKTIHVHGDRYWKSGRISRAEPFRTISLTWNNAFGGREFKPNPLGKGIDQVIDREGKWRIPLPNLELPDRYIGSTDDRPAPACFDALGAIWPQRNPNAGTFDDRWKFERWPDLPDDFDYEYFNMASKDQRLEGFFQPQDPIYIEGMHPDFPQITSSLPPHRVRCFLTRKSSLKEADPEIVFHEVTLQAETLWLFPEILRGVLIFRGSSEVLDDEYQDIQNIFVFREDLASAPASLEESREKLAKYSDRTVTIDPAPLLEAKKKLSKTLKFALNTPKQVEYLREKALGNVPVMPLDLDNMGQRQKKMIAEGLETINRVEKTALAMQQKHGALPFNMKTFANKRASLEKLDEKVTAKLAGAKNKLADLTAAKEKYMDFARQGVEDNANLPPDMKDKLKDAFSALGPKQPESLWQAQAFSFLVECRRNLEHNEPVLRELQRLGYDRRTIRRGWLGFNPEPRRVQYKEWGAGRGKGAYMFPLGAGLVIPYFKKREIELLAIRPGATAEELAPGLGRLVPGSKLSSRFLRAAQPGGPMLVTTDMLQALLLEQELGHFCHVLSLFAPRDKPGDEALEALDKAPVVLLVLSAGTTAKEIEHWKGKYPQIQPLLLSQGRNVLEAHLLGEEVDALIMDALPPDLRKKHALLQGIPVDGSPKKDKGGLVPPLPQLDLKTVIPATIQEVREKLQSKVLSPEEGKKMVLDQARQILSGSKVDLDKILNNAPEIQKKGLNTVVEELIDTVKSQKNTLQKQGLLTPESAAKFDKLDAFLQKNLQMEDKVNDAKARVAAAKETHARLKAGELPPDIAARFAENGFDASKLRRLTRPEVEDYLKNGRSFAGCNLSELDLSRLDFCGADLSSANLRKADFSHAILDKADLTKSMAQEACFKNASLKEARLHRTLFNKAEMEKADLSGADCEQPLFSDANLKQADFSDANLMQAIFERSVLEGCVFSGATLQLALFLNADAQDTLWKGSIFKKSLLRDCCLDRADFFEAKLESAQFMTCAGEEVSFRNADFSHGRIGRNSCFSGADFSNALLREICFRDSDLSGAKLEGIVLDGSQIEACDLTRTNFRKSSAKKCRFNNSNLEAANLRGINLMHGSLRKARLVNTDLTGSNLYAVNFYKAVFGKTRLELCNLKRSLLEGRTELLP